MPIPKGRAPPAESVAPTRRCPGQPPADSGVSEEPFLINVAGEVFTKDYAEFGREVGQAGRRRRG